MCVWKWFVSGNKMSVEICEINNIEYLQKLIYTERNKKLCNNIYTQRFLMVNETSACG